MSAIIAQNLAKLAQFASKKLKIGNGEAAPGLIALKIDPQFIAHKHQNINTKILITGTNGKTTTTNLIFKILSQQNHKPITNLNGSNLERGIASSLISHRHQNFALWECDEAAFNKIAIQVKPTHIIIANLFRDQLDRYGEINTILNRWKQTLEKIPSCNLIVNSDDPNLVWLTQNNKKHNVYYFSLIANQSKELKSSADAIFCPQCQSPLKYKQVNFSHLGQYYCSCQFTHPQAHFELKNIHTTSVNQTCFNLLKQQQNNNQTYSSHTQLTGTYNLYNILAAFSLSQILKLDSHQTLDTIQNFQAVKGRQELIKNGSKNIQFYLVKNPTGFDQVIDTLTQKKQKLTILIALNDNIADGTDVSWIWDVDFELLSEISSTIIITGTRVWDLALRIKYTNFNIDHLIIGKSPSEAIKQLLSQKENDLYILPTYTALWQLRKILINK